MSLGNDDEYVTDYLKRKHAENPNFFYAIECTADQSNPNIFWVDTTFRTNYSYFGDTVRLDTSYKLHHCMPPLVSITGLSHHGQPLLFGCGLLNYDSDSSYIWLLQNWLHAMSGNHPVSMTTEPDHRIRMAVAKVLPQTRHRFCRWSILRETHEKLAHPTFHEELKKCVHETETVNEFESCWHDLVDRYKIGDNEWLKSIYSARHQWVPVYMKDTFFGELHPTEETSNRNMFFDGYVNATSSMQSLVKQYESALTSWHELELRADFETTNTTPVLKTPSPMEKQAASLYTRLAFLKFQDELVETLANPATKVEDIGTVTTYRVAKFGDREKAYIVRFNSSEMKAVCSCHMFEFSGIICRHALSVFRAKNVLTLPSQYVLKRWSRDANVPNINSEHDSLTKRYDTLRKEAMKFVEEGSKSIHIYNVARDALKVAANKVAVSKKRVNHSLMLNQETQEGEKEKRIRELTTELENTNERCEMYRSNLLAVLREMEEQKLKLSVKVQNARLTLKE
ncbi:protein FAR1-RELATED SEQUENCE 9-like [Bidens hawaiensis]|uniref:protein FAR1-RELATED SEQUENCE 9-like n=1 Tax=Bidens hawaiensis TaxID=980011 RepID=UPI00404B59B3